MDQPFAFESLWHIEAAPRIANENRECPDFSACDRTRCVGSRAPERQAQGTSRARGALPRPGGGLCSLSDGRDARRSERSLLRETIAELECARFAPTCAASVQRTRSVAVSLTSVTETCLA